MEGGAVTSGEPCSSRGAKTLQTDGTRPQVRPIYARTPTHTRTPAGRAPAGPRPSQRVGGGVVPRVRAQPPAGARARFPGQSARRRQFHARGVRPALTLAIAAEGRGRRARKRKVSGGCRDRVVIAAASGDTTSTASLQSS